jgi:hypothetical protein
VRRSEDRLGLTDPAEVVDDELAATPRRHRPQAAKPNLSTFEIVPDGQPVPVCQFFTVIPDTVQVPELPDQLTVLPDTAYISTQRPSGSAICRGPSDPDTDGCAPAGQMNVYVPGL